jgi:hypothetical protein
MAKAGRLGKKARVVKSGGSSNARFLLNKTAGFAGGGDFLLIPGGRVPSQWAPTMGQQSNKIIKRRRRADYLKRKNEQAKLGGIVKKSAVKKAVPAPAKKAPAKKAAAKKAPAKKAAKKVAAEVQETAPEIVETAAPETTEVAEG